MKIEITKKEYRVLLDILSIADWIITYEEPREGEGVAAYEGLTQKLLAFAAEAGVGSLVTHDAVTGRYSFTADFEDSSRSWKFIDEFADGSFWEELSYRLAERDAARQAGGFEKLRFLNREKRSALHDPIRERYDAEFRENGVDRLVIAEQFGADTGGVVKTHD